MVNEREIAPWVCRLVRRRAKSLARSPRLRHLDCEDIEQELYAALLARRGRPGRDLMVALVDLAARDLLRRYRHDPPQTNAQSEVLDSPQVASDQDRRIDVADVLAELPAELRTLAEELKFKTPSAIARQRHCSFQFIREQIVELRRRFTAAGLTLEE